MEKYNSIIGKRICLVMDNKPIAAYKITEIDPTPFSIPYLGTAYKCFTEWEPSNFYAVNEQPKSMDFEEKTLEDLCSTGISQSPIMPQMQFVVDNKN